MWEQVFFGGSGFLALLLSIDAEDDGGNDDQAVGDFLIAGVDPQEGEAGVHDIEDEGPVMRSAKPINHHALMMFRNADM